MNKFVMASGVSVMLALAAVALWLGKPASVGDQAALTPEQAGINATAGAIYSASFRDTDGKERTLGEWQHKLLIINFWATWCAPCREEMPVLAKLQQEYGGKKLQVVGIAADSLSNVVKFAEKLPMPYPLLPDEARAIEFSKRLGNRLGLLPFTVAVSPGGDIVFVRLGIITETEIRNLAMKMLSN